MTRRMAARWTVPGPGLPPPPAAIVPTYTEEVVTDPHYLPDGTEPSSWGMSVEAYTALVQFIGRRLADAAYIADARALGLPPPLPPARDG